MKEKVLQAMREFGAPVNAGKIAEITGIDRKEVDKAFAELKKEGAIVSPFAASGSPHDNLKASPLGLRPFPRLTGTLKSSTGGKQGD